MKKNGLLKRMAAIASCVVLTMTMITGCGKAQNNGSGNDSENSVNNGAGQSEELSGSILLAGSTSMEKLATALAESFMEKYPGTMVSAEFTGSSAGVEAVLAGTSDIGNASRNLKESEKEAGAVENIVAIDGIAVVVDTKNAVSSISKQQLADIYTGKLTNWSELGGSDTPIVVVGREAGSGTRGAFEEILEVEDLCLYAVECDSTGATMAKVASTEGAIGYVSLDVVDDSVVAIKLDGVEATAENIVAGSYFLCRPFVMATKGEILAQSELVQAFFEYIKSEEGKAIVEAVGLIVAE